MFGEYKVYIPWTGIVCPFTCSSGGHSPIMHPHIQGRAVFLRSPRSRVVTLKTWPELLNRSYHLPNGGLDHSVKHEGQLTFIWKLLRLPRVKPVKTEKKKPPMKGAMKKPPVVAAKGEQVSNTKCPRLSLLHLIGSHKDRGIVWITKK